MTKASQEYPELEDDGIREALEFAADSLDDQIICCRPRRADAKAGRRKA